MKTLAPWGHLDARLETIRMAVLEQAKRFRAIRPHNLEEMKDVVQLFVDTLADRLRDAEQCLKAYNLDPGSMAKYDRVFDALKAVSHRLNMSQSLLDYL